MSSASKVLERLSAQGVELWADGERLRYRAPGEALDRKSLEDLREHKQELLSLLRDKPERSFTPTFGQRALWMKRQMDPQSAAYNVALAVRVLSQVDVQALRRSLTTLAGRHSALRSTFTQQDGEIIQIVHRHRDPKFECIDGGAWSEADLACRVKEAYRQPFDLEAGPLFRATLFSRGEADHVLLLTLHHIVCDAWSFWILMDDLRVLYRKEAFAENGVALPSPTQFADFARWEVDLLATSSAVRLSEFWTNELNGAPAVLALPTNRLRTPAQTGNGASVAFGVDDGLVERLRLLAREEGATLYQTLLAAFETLLHRYTGEPDFVIGSPSAGRDDVRFTRSVGYFVNMLAVRADLSGDPSFTDLLSRVRRKVLAALQHQDYPFPLLLEQLRMEHDSSRTPLFQTTFNLQQMQGSRGLAGALIPGAPAVDWGGLLLSHFDLPQQEGQFDLSLELVDTPGRLLGVFKYNTDLFDRETIERMAGHYLRLLAAIVDAPAQRVSELRMLSEAEEQQLREWNATDRDYKLDLCLHQHFEAQVERTPEAIALVSENGSWSYGELNARANRLARELRRRGVKPETRVALCAERSLEMMVGLYAVVKAGGAWVPLDAEYPVERLQYMLEDSGAELLLSQEHLRERLPATKLPILWLEGDWSGHSSENLVTETGPENLAYVIYTSGSSGRPKGAMNQQRGICNRLLWMQEAYRLDGSDAVLQKTPISFDVSVWELFWPLWTGARLVLARPGGHREPGYLVQRIVEERITTLHCVPSMLGMLVEEEGVRGCESLRRVIASGEALSVELQERFYERLGCELHNLYGPTEAAVDVSSWKCRRGSARVPIGKPIANVRLEVLDGRGQRVAVGVAGELHIGGVGVGRGYQGRAGLTAERFVPDAWSGERGARMYRTGDQARWLAEGEIEYLGRLDSQVKLRGFRIELGEIESVLRSQAGVREAVVLLRHDPPLEPRLVGYISGENVALSVDRIADGLRRTLPDYMNPAAIVALDRLPLNSNGKVDRKALPAPVGNERSDVRRKPRTWAEEVLAGIWQEVLHIEAPGIDDNFFQLGGHSLLVMQVLGRIRRAFQTDLSVADAFAAPTISGLAELIAASAGAPREHIPPLRKFARAAKAPLSFAQQRMFFLQRLEPGNPFYNVPLSSTLRGQLNTDALQAAVDTLVKRHAALRTCFTEDSGQPLQEIIEDVALPIRVVDLRCMRANEATAEATRLANIELNTVFDLAEAPLARANLYRIEDDVHALVLILHHVLTDGWSLGVLARELGALYCEFVTGHPSALPPLEFDYVDFALWQREWLSGPVREAQLEYWRRQLAGIPPILELPTDRPRPSVQRYRGATAMFRVEPGLAAELNRLSRQQHATLFMTLLSAFAALLLRWSGQSDVVIGTPVANRNRPEVEPLTGVFLNSVAMRIGLQDDPVFESLLSRVRRTALDAWAHQDLPFELLVDALQPERSRSQTPIFQVLFVFQNTPADQVSLSGLETAPFLLEGTTAKVDLTLTMQEGCDGIEAAIEYNTDLFDRETIERMAGHYLRLLAAIVDAPAQRVSELRMLSEAEEQQLREWNATDRDYKLDLCLHQHFEAQVERTPEAIALVSENGSWSYGELNARANRLARELRRRGVKPETRVALCAERSLEMMVGLYAVVKAGGAWVPLDAEYPVERLQYMLEDSGAELLLSQEHLRERLPATKLPILWLEGDWSGHSSENLVTETGPENLAYVIYTSGSSGRPKGAMNQQRGICNRLLWMQEAYRLDGSDAVLQKTPISFDVSVWELFWPLWTGARLVLARPGGHREPGYLVQRIVEERITTLHCVPSMLGMLVEEEGVRGCESLRRVIASGEALSVELQERFHERLGCELHNLYGPTEAAVDVSSWKCQRGSARVPIGKPIANVRLEVLDGRGQRVAVGVAGELHIGGVGVGRGYQGRAGLTAERFVPDAWSGERGARMYRTGDQARWLAEGEIEYLGRLDSQVKLRGFRIELGEIESVLRSQAGVREAVVLLRHDPPLEPRLVGYIVPAEKPPELDDLRRALETKVPQYMVPSVFVTLDAIPVSSNGKLDRAALKLKSLEEPAREYVAPRNPAEEALSGIWAELLRLPRVGVHENFFFLGGDSIVSMQVVARARQAGYAINVADLFEHQTVAELARSACPAEALDSSDEPGEATHRPTPIQAWFYERALAEPHHFNQAAIFEIPVDAQGDLLRQAVDTVLARHDGLRAAECAVAGLANIDDASLPAAIEEHAAQLQSTLSLSDGPLCRAVLFETGNGRADRLLLIAHHLVVDGVSWRILLEEMESCYRQLAAGGGVVLPPRTAPFRKWASALQRYGCSDAVAAEVPLWNGILSGGIANLPRDRTDGENIAASAAEVTVTLDEGQTRTLLELLPRRYNTINDALLAALAIALSRWTNGEGVLVDVEGHGREALPEPVDVSRTVGWFTSMFPVCLPALPSGDPGAALRTLKDLLGRLPRNGIGYGLLRYGNTDASGKLRGFSRPEVLFNYLGRFDSQNSWWRRAKESPGPLLSPGAPRSHLLEINSFVADAKLELHWIYSDRIHDRSTIERVASQFASALASLIAHCRECKGEDVEDTYALSPMQEGMLFETLMAPGQGVYWQQWVFTLGGDLKADLFERAWSEVVGRHQALRSTFHPGTTGKPEQIVHSQTVLPWDSLDWSHLDSQQQSEGLKQFLDADRRRGVDLTSAPLMRAALMRVDAQRHYFVWSHHHLLLDGWSVVTVLKEVIAIYKAFDEGHSRPLTPAVPYRDYAAWLARQDHGAAERFWRTNLRGLVPSAALTIDKPAGRESNYHTSDLVLSTESTATLYTQARQHHVTASVMMQAAWALVLSRCSGRTDVAFGLVVATRPGEIRGVEEMVGVLINTIPVRVKIGWNQPASAWLKELHTRQVELERYDYCSLAEIQQWSEASRPGPLFESVLVFENFPIDESLRQQTGAIRFEEVRVEERPHYPLLLVVAPGPQLLVRFSYDASRVESGVVESLADSLRSVLSAMAASVEAPVGTLAGVSIGERRLPDRWNDTAVPAVPCLHQQFEAQARRTPDNIAVGYEGSQLTYRELDKRADRLASSLRARGVRSDSLIGVCVERSIEMVVALLGVLKAGAAYVPLDPGYPADRLAFMIDDARVSLLLTETAVARRLPPFHCSVICLDSNGMQSAGTVPCTEVTSDNLAYVIYTSGSTGRPKGVMQNHLAISNHMAWMQQVFPLDSSDRVLQKTPFSFDASIWEFYAPLFAGGQLVMARPGGHQEPAWMVEAIQKHGITTLQLVPSQLNLLLAEEGFAKCTSLRRVFCGGEALTPELQRRFFAVLPGTPLINLYGPTETCIDSTFAVCNPEHPTSTIGSPVSNTQAWILNTRLEAVPCGIRGELHIGGAGLARGYLRRPGLTAERFVPNPFEPGARLYRTGDLARFLPDGNIEYLGRADHQVKLRGFRVELEEIEAVLSACEAIRQAAVIVSDDRLIGCFVAAADASPEVAMLREALQQKLPEHMVPGVFIRLDALPLTPSGKVDREALAAMATGTTVSEKKTDALPNPFQELIRDAFAKVLRLDPTRIGVHDNFFELGGHSLLATQLVSRIRSTFAVEMRLRQFFEAPSVAGVAALIQARQLHRLSPPRIERRPANREAPLSYAQQRIWFLDQMEGARDAYNIPAALRIEGTLDTDALEAAFSELVRRHEALRTTFHIREGEVCQMVSEPEPFRIRVIGGEGLTADEQERLLEAHWREETHLAFELTSGPLLRATLLQLHSRIQVLMVNVHHIAADGWSVDILVRELTTLYDAFTARRSSPLRPLPIQYADFAVWQRQWLSGENLDHYLSYWTRQLEGAPAVLTLPLDYPRPLVETHRGAHRRFTIVPELYQNLKALGRQADTTLFMTLLAGFAALLARRSGQDDLVIGSPIANRNYTEVEGLIGVFVNNLALRIDLSGKPSFRELLRRVRLMALDAFTQQDLPFERLVEALKPQRDLRHSPIFQVLFSLQTSQSDRMAPAGLKLEPLDLKTDTAKYDLSLYMVETPDGLSAEFEYNPSLFAPATIGRMADQYTQLLASAAANSDVAVADLDLLDASQRDELLIEWNQTKRGYDSAVGLTELFECAAARNPEAVAVTFGSEHVTYRELQQRIDTLARGLVCLGVGPEVPVGVLMERSVEMLVATLAVMKAGGAYVPLDPAYPAQRIEYMLRDSGAALVLTQESLAGIVSKSPSSSFVEFPRVHPENLAYVIYTSGSTGRPKGVEVTRGGLTNFLLSMRLEPGLQQHDALLAVTTLSFDIAALELYLPLITGARVVLASHDDAVDGLRLLDLLKRSGATVMQGTPATWRILVESGWSGDPPVRVFCGGEALPADLACKLRMFGASVWNLYGPTETTIWSSTHALHMDHTVRTSLPIGRPIANTEMFVLDRNMRPQPAGVTGDLYIGGDGVARGYFQRAALTAEAFVPSPFSKAGGARLYRTGDLARVLHDGCLECLGRTDNQSKLRGFRIELGEIEAVLARHSQVREVAVMIREDVAGDHRLVAYVVPREPQVIDEASLRALAVSMLPRYMVPSHFVSLAALPLTANSKIDRRALPVVTLMEPAKSVQHPSTELEKTIAAIWRDVLGRESIGLHDNFFDLGGHSLLLVRVQLELRKRLGREIGVVDLFAHPNVAALASHLSPSTGEPHGNEGSVDARAARRREALVRRKVAHQ